MGYSTVALQEMNLAYRFPIIYWNTACLSVNAGAVNEEDYESLIEDEIIEIDENDDDKRESSKIQYGKVAAAISKFRDELGLKIFLPDVNKSKFGFTPDANANAVLYGLKGISRVGDNIIRSIIQNRPYNSLKDFLNKLNSDKTIVSKDKVVMLIKAGAFDLIENRPRIEIFKSYIEMISEPKKKLTLQNLAKLIEMDLIPEELEFEVKIYNFTKYLRKNKVDKAFYELDEVALSFYYENFGSPTRVNTSKGVIDAVKMTEWDKIYDKYMDNVRSFITSNQQELLSTVNQRLFDEEFEKYGSGNELSWEIEAINFYHSGHELKDIETSFPIEISNIKNVVENEIDGYFTIRKKNEETNKLDTLVIPRYKIQHIIGTVLDKDKSKKMVTLSTPNGVITVKLFGPQFANYDKTIISYDADGNKEIIQPSFFDKGTFLLVTGMKRGESFVPKVYKDMDIDPILMFKTENGKFKKAFRKIGE